MTTIDSQGNITHVKGDTFALTFIDVKLDGVLINWTGYKMRFVVKTDMISEVIVLELTEISGIDLSVIGQIAMIEAAAIMKTIVARNYIYDLEVTNPAEDVCTWFNAKQFKILHEVA